MWRGRTGRGTRRGARCPVRAHRPHRRSAADSSVPGFGGFHHTGTGGPISGAELHLQPLPLPEVGV